MTKQKKPEFQKIRQLRLRFGFRLRSIFWPLDSQQVGQILDKIGYKDIEVDSAGGVRAAKNNIDFYSDRVKMVFGFYASTVDLLITAQKEFFAAAQNNFEANLHNFIRFYEIENAISYNLESSKNTVQGVFSDSSDKKQISDIVGEEIALSKLDVGKANASIQEDDWFNIEISPKTESAGNAYYCRMLKRSKNNDEIIKTLRKSTKILEDMAVFAEKKNKGA